MKNNINVILTSREKNYVFDLCEEKGLIYDIYESSNLVESNILAQNIRIYSATIDFDDTIYVLALNNLGDLIYYRYFKEQWSSQIIAKFDISSNLYNQLEIFIHGDNLHILYNYSNLINSNVWTIQHIIYNQGIKKKYNAIRYLARKYPKPFIFDIDNIGNIHLIYQSNIEKPQIHYGFYSPFANKWSYKNKKISRDDINSLSPNIFIDSKDTIHITWIEKENKTINPKYIKMNSKGKEKYIWTKVDLPYISNLNIDSSSILFEEKNILKYLYESDDNVYLIYSKDFGSTWIKENSMKQLDKYSKLSKIALNKKDNLYKLNYGYIKLLPKLNILYLNINEWVETNDSTSHIIDKDDKKININDDHSCIDKKLEDDIDTDILDCIDSINSNIENILSYHPSIKSYLEDIIEHQKILENKINNLEIYLNKNDKTFIEKIFGFNK